MKSEEQLQEMIDISMSILSKSNLSLKQKQQIVNTISEIIAINKIKETTIDKLRTSIYGLNDKTIVNDYINKHVALVRMTNDSDYNLENINPDSYEFVLKHKDKLKSPVTISGIVMMAKYYNFYVMLHNSNPKSLEELKKFIQDVKN